MVEFKAVTKAFGAITVLKDVDLKVEAGEVVVLIGPSGSGKSTLLRCINALETIDAGDLKPKLMLFDEPTSALDPELRHEVLRVMQQLADEGMTMIVVTHEMSFARKVGTRLIFMEGGKISVDGNPAQLLDHPENPRLRDFLQHVH